MDPHRLPTTGGSGGRLPTTGGSGGRLPTTGGSGGRLFRRISPMASGSVENYQDQTETQAIPKNTMSDREWEEYERFMVQEAIRASKQNDTDEDGVDFDEMEEVMPPLTRMESPYLPAPSQGGPYPPAPLIFPTIQLPLFLPPRLQGQLPLPVQVSPLAPVVVPPPSPKRPKTRPLPLFTPEQRQELLIQYRKYWTQIYGIDPNLAERARLFRERELAKMGGLDALREKRLHEFESKISSRRSEEKSPSERATILIQRLYRHYRSIVCENQSTNGRHLGEVILCVRTTDGKSHYLCHDVINLMMYLRDSYHREDLWKEPTYGVLLTRDQKRILHYRYQKLCSFSSRSTQMVVGNSGTDRISIPRSLFNRAMSEESSPYLLYRITNTFSRLSMYIVAMDFHDLDPQTIFLSPAILNRLKLSDEDIIQMEEAFHLPKATYLLLKPLTPEWYAIPDSDTDIVKGILTTTLEKEYVISMGSTLTISHRGKTYPLQVMDVTADSGLGSRRTYSAMTKFTSVKIEIMGQKTHPESKGPSISKTNTNI